MVRDVIQRRTRSCHEVIDAGEHEVWPAEFETALPQSVEATHGSVVTDVPVDVEQAVTIIAGGQTNPLPDLVE